MSGLSGVAALDFIAPNANVRSLARVPDDGVGPLAAPDAWAAAGSTEAGASPSFGSALGAQLQQLDASLKAGEEQALRLASGQAESLHRVMLDIEQARISLQLAMQVRNRVLEAVQDLQRWQL